jgi:1,4-alpha-glucan branching enzyme
VTTPDETNEPAVRNDDDFVEITFRLPPDVDALSASVVGEFNEWNPEAGVMESRDDRGFETTLLLAPGRRYRYRYLLDGDRWVNDWQADGYAPNEFGGDDSVVDVY